MRFTQSFGRISSRLAKSGKYARKRDKAKTNIKLRLHKEQQINQELLLMSEEQLLAALEEIKSGVAHFSTPLQQKRLEEWLAYGELSASQRKRINSTADKPSAIADGLGGGLIIINVMRTIFGFVHATLTAAEFFSVALVTGGLAIAGGSIVIYSLYSGAKSAWKTLVSKLKLANCQQKILTALNIKAQQQLAEQAMAALIALHQLSERYRAILEELVLLSGDEYVQLKSLLNEAETNPDWYSSLIKQVAAKDLAASQRFVILQKAIVHVSDVNVRNKILHYLGVEAGIKTIAEQSQANENKNIIKPSPFTWQVAKKQLENSDSDVSYLKQKWSKFKRGMVKMENTLPGVTTAGMGFTIFACFGLGGATLLKTTGVVLGAKVLGGVALALTGPYGLAILGGIALVAGIYFGYKYYCKFKEINEAKEVKKQVKSVNRDKHSNYHATKELGKELGYFAEKIKSVDSVNRHEKQVSKLEQELEAEKVQKANLQTQCEQLKKENQLLRQSRMLNQTAGMPQDTLFRQRSFNTLSRQ